MSPLYPLALFVASLGIAGISQAQATSDDTETGNTESTHRERYGEISCLVEPGRQATLSTRIPGVISELLVRAGDEVEAGQPLFRQARQVEEASVALEGTRAEYASRRLQRNQRMIDQGMLSDSEQDELSTEVRLARMQVNLADAQLAQRTTSAPFEGLVTALHAEEGEYIDATPVLELVQLGPLRIEVVLPLPAYGRLSVGDSLPVTIQTPTTRELDAEVERIDSVIDASSGTFGVGLVLENPEGTIPAGINCSI